MDNQHQPPQQPQSFQVHNHTPEQKQILAQMLTGVVSDLCNFVFNDPSKDQQMIRAHAALMGKKELLQQLLADHYPPPPEQEVQSLQPADSDVGAFNLGSF